jgi:Pentapeptide repeats (9 copies)
MVDGPSGRGDDNTAKAHERGRLLRRLAVVGPLVLGLLVILLLACVLWIPRWLYPPLTETDLRGVSDAAKVQELKGARLKLENDARTTLLQGLAAVLVLTGAAIGAAVTLRQIRISQGQLQATRAQMQHTLETTQQQLNLTEQGQITDRYTKAVEQLGHEKAPVRLGALYSLEHLAQDNPNYRQTVVDVVCAYLRMPYTPPAQQEPGAEQVQELALPANGPDRAVHPGPGRDPAREELQVRQTAQRLLADHLRRPPETSGQEAQLLSPSPQQAFWPAISLDLTGATLVDFGFAQVSVIRARFEKATFQGDAGFAEATFQGPVTFGHARFQGDAGFYGATFQGNAWFDRAYFQGSAWFLQATFQGDATFVAAAFLGNAEFDGATFQATTAFSGATFQATTGFRRATFQVTTWFDNAQVLRLDVFDKYQVWPEGWTVHPDPTDPSRGTLVKD